VDVARVRVLACVIVLAGCVPHVSLDGSIDEPADDDAADSTLPPEAPDAPGDAAWTGPSVPREDGHWAWTEPGELPELKDEAGHALPLRHTDVHAVLRGSFAEVRVTQTFRNDAPDPIEVVYAFPLPENSAVSSMRMVIGERVIESDIAERGEARRIYEDAREDGHTAALLEQERPNIFTHSVANVPPGEDIDVEVRYLQTLSYDAGEYEFVFPLVIGPRFVPGTPLDRPPSGVGTRTDTDAVPDASRISPPVVGHGVRRGDDVSITVEAHAGAPIDRFVVPTHEVESRAIEGGLSLSLREADEIPNRDFVMRYRVVGDAPRATMLLGPKGKSGSGRFVLVAHPPQMDVDAVVGRREMIFVIDCSGSMWGEPLALAKETLREALGHLRPVDTFDVVSFESTTDRAFETPRPANAANLARALRFVDGISAGGGTMMGSAVDLALGGEVGAGRNRYVMMLTDGFIGNEDEIFRGAEALVKRIGERGQKARVFAVGIGSSPNHHLLSGLSKVGRGVPLLVGNREAPERAVNAFVRYVDKPVVSDLELEPGGLALSGQHPHTLPDLFASHPVIVLGEYAGEASSAPVLVGHADGKRVEIPVRIEAARESDDALDVLWARAAVADLEVALWSGDPEGAAKAEITRLGLRHHIVTPFTSLVAVDRRRRFGDGSPRRVVEPQLAPEGVDPAMAGAIPIGDATSRDFTQVVTSASGISLAGSTGAEQAYRVEGANVVRAIRVAPGTRLDRPGTELRGEWDPNPRLVIGRLSAADGVRTSAVRTGLRRARAGLRTCYAASASFSREARHPLRFRLSWSASGGVEITIVAGSIDESTDACLVRALQAIAWPRQPEGTSIDVPLTLSAH
jgi:Ca-activated chloride channel family protein